MNPEFTQRRPHRVRAQSVSRSDLRGGRNETERTALRRFVALGTAIIVATGNSSAQTAGEIASRRVLLDQAQQARAARDHVRALDLAQRAGGLRMSASVRLFIADEQYAVGDLPAALGSAESCAREAAQDTTASDRELVARRCRALAADLRRMIGFVTVRVSQPFPSGLVVHVGGTLLNRLLIGVPSVVSPGTVTIDATADGRRPFRRDLIVSTGADVGVDVSLEPLEDGVDAAATARPSNSSSATLADPLRAPTSATRSDDGTDGYREREPVRTAIQRPVASDGARDSVSAVPLNDHDARSPMASGLVTAVIGARRDPVVRPLNARSNTDPSAGHSLDQSHTTASEAVASPDSVAGSFPYYPVATIAGVVGIAGIVIGGVGIGSGIYWTGRFGTSGCTNPPSGDTCTPIVANINQAQYAQYIGFGAGAVLLVAAAGIGIAGAVRSPTNAPGRARIDCVPWIGAGGGITCGGVF